MKAKNNNTTAVVVDENVANKIMTKINYALIFSIFMLTQPNVWKTKCNFTPIMMYYTYCTSNLTVTTILIQYTSTINMLVYVCNARSLVT